MSYNGTLKLCRGCDVEKPRTKDYWWRNAARKDGLQNACIQCLRRYYRRKKRLRKCDTLTPTI